MNCSKCGKNLSSNSLFCPSCGTKVEIIESKKNKIELNKTQKIITLSLLSIIVIMLGLVMFLPNNNGSRTIMLYVVGSNLETDSHIVTKDLESIDTSKIDLNKTNVLLYTGGTKTWHNFVSNEDNGTYILKKDGFKKLKSEQQYNLGSPDTLTNFLKYAYNNYKADKYDLILYDHGGAIDGAIYDDISNDNLSLEDMNLALKNSPFNENNKLEAVLFRTCLNGTLEVANIFKPYANYLIGSEEISWGSSRSSVLNFINDLNSSDNGKDFGIKFVNAYEMQMKTISPLGTTNYTYSVIDLSKIDKVNKALDEYISKLDVKNNYSTISKIRATLYQYGNEDPSYDMIDLYDFVNSIKEYNQADASNLLQAIDNSVLYSNSNIDTAHGLSIYFPYNGKKMYQQYFLNIYQNLNELKNYGHFITSFNSIQNKPTSYSFNIKDNEIKKEDTTKSVSIQLTKEQVENYAYSTFVIFEQDMEHPNYYWVLLNSDDVKLSKDGILTANYENSFIKLFDKDDNKDYYIYVYYRQKYGRKVTAILYGKKENLEEKLQTELNPIVDLYITTDNKGKPTISNAKLRSDNERLDGILLNINDYDTYNIIRSRKKILDNSGNVLDTSEWESPPEFYMLYGKNDELKTGLKYTSLDKGNNYYALFLVTDTNNQVSYSKLIKVGE